MILKCSYPAMLRCTNSCQMANIVLRACSLKNTSMVLVCQSLKTLAFVGVDLRHVRGVDDVVELRVGRHD